MKQKILRSCDVIYLFCLTEEQVRLPPAPA
jgi:hypothetical protein